MVAGLPVQTNRVGLPAVITSSSTTDKKVIAFPAWKPVAECDCQPWLAHTRGLPGWVIHQRTAIHAPREKTRGGQPCHVQEASPPRQLRVTAHMLRGALERHPAIQYFPPPRTMMMASVSGSRPDFKNHPTT